jgi:hypothetical protein
MDAGPRHYKDDYRCVRDFLDRVNSDYGQMREAALFIRNSDFDRLLLDSHLLKNMLDIGATLSGLYSSTV